MTAKIETTDQPCDCVLRIKLERQRDELLAALEATVEFASEAHSGYISGTGSDIKWQEKRDESVTASRAAIAKVKQS